LICQECHVRPAALHFTKIVNGQKNEFHICEQCAQEKGYSSFFSSSSANFSFSKLLSGLLNHSQTSEEKQTAALSKEEVLSCQKCGMTYQKFTKLGRFGCAGCYESFLPHVEPILRRVHSGNTVHQGKIPKRMGGNLHLRKELDELKVKLQQYIHQEEFENAATVRDKIRNIEKQLSEHRRED
jgi:protein arginine kinase activator